MATRYATTNDGVNIAYIRVGDGPPIVFAANNCDALITPILSSKA
jgi:hypothetical protein